MVLVTTKLHAPTVRPGMLPRDALVVRLAAGVNARLVLVCAPAGWGKTMLLAQWRTPGCPALDRPSEAKLSADWISRPLPS